MSKIATQQNTVIARPPIVVVMGHIDHGKSTLLDYIRKTNIVATEVGGITQHLGAYEVAHTTKEGKAGSITFLDTPGHEAFSTIRSRGARVADIAILVVSAEEGVKEQTLDALRAIKAGNVPYIVAINKIDRPTANVEKTKQSLLEHEIYIEGYGGTIPAVAISAKTGEGVPELLDLLVLSADLMELKADPTKLAEGIVIEAIRDPKRGISCTLIVKNGTLKKGQTLTCGESVSPVRIMENYLGKKIDEARPGQPIRVVGWSGLPAIGSPFKTFESKKEAEQESSSFKEEAKRKRSAKMGGKEEQSALPFIIKADTIGSLEAIEHEIDRVRLKIPQVPLRIIHEGIGDITENDVKMGLSGSTAIIFGFNIEADESAKALAERMNIPIELHTIIYKLAETLETVVSRNIPQIEIPEVHGTAKILKTFSVEKDKQIVGGKVISGLIKLGDEVIIRRRETELGKGKIRSLQQQKVKASEIKKDTEFGTMIESKVEIAAGDVLESFTMVKKPMA